ncbi:MAG TPA: OmpA family protein [Chitinophagaceae bacterium]|nr:OmpA family protein [Chitinophagaceae bacterium]
MRGVRSCFLLCALVVSTAANAQFLKKMKERAENAVTNKAGEAVDKNVNKAADKVLNGEKSQQKSETKSEEKSETKTEAKAQTEPSLKAYSKFDFVPGSQVLLADDFSQDVIGEFPKMWNTNNKGEVVQLSVDNNKWLKMAYNSSYVSPVTKPLPENFTLEFDVILDMTNKGAGYPEWNFHFFNHEADPSDPRIFKTMTYNTNLIVRLLPGEFGNSHMILVHSEGAGGNEIFKSKVQYVKFIEDLYKKPMHVAFSVQGQRFRMWINEVKLYDLPKVYPAAAKFNRFAITAGSSNYGEDDLGLYFSNFKLAAGSPDTRSKLLTEGKWSTTAITFDVNSDKLKPSSMGVIKEIADIMAANADMKVRIIGHTDSDGAKDANQVLSEKRAKAVEEALVKIYSIDESRIETAGKGAAEPVSDNKTQTGKSQNRRVEFVRL